MGDLKEFENEIDFMSEEDYEKLNEMQPPEKHDLTCGGEFENE